MDEIDWCYRTPHQDPTPHADAVTRCHTAIIGLSRTALGVCQPPPELGILTGQILFPSSLSRCGRGLFGVNDSRPHPLSPVIDDQKALQEANKLHTTRRTEVGIFPFGKVSQPQYTTERGNRRTDQPIGTGRHLSDSERRCCSGGE